MKERDIEPLLNFFRQLKGKLFITCATAGPAPYRVTYRLNPKSKSPVEEKNAEAVIRYLKTPLIELATKMANKYFRNQPTNPPYLHAVFGPNPKCKGKCLLEIQAIVYTKRDEDQLRQEIEERNNIPILRDGTCPICGNAKRNKSIACRGCKDYLFRLRKIAKTVANLDYSKFKEAMELEKAKWDENARKKRPDLKERKDPANWEVLLKLLWADTVQYAIPEHLRPKIVELK